MKTEPKITLGEMREGRAGVRGLLVYCADYRCGHHVRIAPEDADKWPDDVRLSELGAKFTCAVCGHRGADVRPDFGTPKMGTGS